MEKARKERQGHLFQTNTPTRNAATTDEVTKMNWAALKQISVPTAATLSGRLVAIEGRAEAAPYDMLRTRILQQARKNNWRRVALVSPDSGCGKSTTVGNLAFSFARQNDIRTVVLDLDLRRSGLTALLRQNVPSTFADILEGRTAFADHGLRYGENVLFGLNGKPVRNPAELLQSQAVTDWLAEIEASYSPDIMLFDLPPLTGSDDNVGFLKNVDCAIIIIEAERTTRDQIDQSERQVADLTNVMGLVLNKCHYVDDTYDYAQP